LLCIQSLQHWEQQCPSLTFLLDFSRIEAGRVQASYQPTDIAAFTAELASSHYGVTGSMR
jgi:hypothetical protein